MRRAILSSRAIRSLVAVLAVVLLVGGAAGAVALRGGDSSVTRPRLERSLPALFANLYVQQARLVGHDDVTAASLHARAMCDKHGPDVPDVGPGGDWTCLMSWDDPHLPMPAEGYGKFELNVHSNSCFTATGPSKLIGFITLTDTKGREVPNPVFEFDGCFDPDSTNAPTGVSFPSLLNVTSTALTPDAERRGVVQLSCGMGSGGCTGTLTATAGEISLGQVPFHLAEESTKDIVLPVPVPAGASQVTLVVDRSVGVGSTSPITIPVM